LTGRRGIRGSHETERRGLSKYLPMLIISVGAGTVEFIMDAETGEYFFMEM
jgi:biotin carboxylase